jgi:imidazole glycerol-phosphate synthase subunit HisH
MTTRNNAKLLTIVDYGMGNLRSVTKAFTFLGAEVCVSSIPEDLRRADALILPGVGAFEDGMNNLKSLGLIEVMNEEILDKKKPFLGICLGMQLIADTGHENGSHEGLGWLRSSVEKLETGGQKLKLPHIGWDDVDVKKKDPLFENMSPAPCFYFVHNYHLRPEKEEYVTSTCTYGKTFAASIQAENIFGTQFHPEKSQREGLLLLQNFIDHYSRM